MNPAGNSAPKIRMLLFDFGGVLAEEGFREGLMAIARRAGLDPDQFFATATEAVYDCGYVLGNAGEADYWRILRERTSIAGTDRELSREILDRFTLRPGMITIVRALRQKGCGTAILSDQTDWLDRLDEAYTFFQEFDAVFNSYHLGKSKRDPSLFTDTITRLKVQADQTLFVDDNQGNIERAASLGLHVHLFRDEADFAASLRKMHIL